MEIRHERSVAKVADEFDGQGDLQMDITPDMAYVVYFYFSHDEVEQLRDHLAKVLEGD